MKDQSKLVIFDLDGCISDDEWRRGMIDERKPDKYGTYHEQILDDDPVLAGKDHLAKCISAGEFPVFITARPFKYAPQTRTWIQKHLGLFATDDYWLFMRDNLNTKSSVDIKREALALIKRSYPNAKIVCGYDDREDVVTMYRCEGIEAYILDKTGIRPPTFDPFGRTGRYLNGEVNVPATDAGAALGGQERHKVVSKEEMQARIAAAQSVAIGRDALDKSQDSPQDAGTVLLKAAATFRERNAVYKDNAVNVGNVMKALFPNGVRLNSAEDHHIYHLFELIIVKLTRFANSDLHHIDSIHDVAVYAAMIEPLVGKHDINSGK
jgi:hypothetical protein